VRPREVGELMCGMFLSEIIPRKATKRRSCETIGLGCMTIRSVGRALGQTQHKGILVCGGELKPEV